VSGVALHLLDVDAGVEAPTLGAQHDRPRVAVLAGLPERVREREPAGNRERVDGRGIHDHLDDPVVVAHAADGPVGRRGHAASSVPGATSPAAPSML